MDEVANKIPVGFIIAHRFPPHVVGIQRLARRLKITKHNAMSWQWGYGGLSIDSAKLYTKFYLPVHRLQR